MSLKFAALCSLTILDALRTPARADDQVLNLGQVEPHEAILTASGRRRGAVAPEKLDAGESIRQEGRGAISSSRPRNISGVG